VKLNEVFSSMIGCKLMKWGVSYIRFNCDQYGLGGRKYCMFIWIEILVLITKVLKAMG